jgi:enoyl-CoA hydratase
MSEPVLLVEKNDEIAILTLNRPDQLNALSMELRLALEAELERIGQDDSIRAVILTGAGRAFCAGLDLKEMGDPELRQAAGDPPDPPKLLRSIPQPVIGAINGIAVTGGFEIALSCDVLVATPDTQFADTHARIGILAGWGLSQRLSRAIGVNRAKELSLTGNYLSAEKAYDWGLVNRVVRSEELMPTCIGLATDMCSCVPETMMEYKRMIDRGYDMPLADAMAFELEAGRAHVSPSAEVVAERRLKVQERGRAQAKN